MPRMDMPEGANVAVPGQYSLVQAPLSNKGNPTSQGFNNLMLVEQSQPVRIVDKSGEVLFEGIGPEAAQQAVVIGKGLSDTLGKKAGWDIQTVPVGTSDFKTIANEKVNNSALGVIADIGLPILASALIPGGGLLGTILPSAAGSAASSVAQGRSLGDTLLRAAIAGGGAGLGESVFGPGIPSGNAVAPTASLAADVLPNLPSLLDDIAATAAQNVAAAGLGAIAPAVIPSIAGDIVATAIKTAAPSIAGSAIGSTAGSALSSALMPETIVQAQTQPRYEAPTVTPPVSLTNDILVNAQTQTAPQSETPSVAPQVSFPSDILVNAQTQPTTQPNTQSVAPPVSFPTDILVTAPTAAPVTPSPVPDVGPLDIAGTPISELLKDVAMGPENKSLLDRITSNMGVTDYLTAASLLGSAVAGGGGGGGTGATTPYVSPFGAGTGFGAGMDYRAQPNILDYERYGFGPEAMFFRPEYSRLVSGASAAPAAPAASTTPIYQPLI